MNQTDTRSRSTDCLTQPLLFDNLGTRQVVADFSGGYVSSDGGLLLLRQMNASLGLTRQLSECFHDGRDSRYVEHAVAEMVTQRVLGLASGYEDLNDHQQLRHDPLLALAVERQDLLGEERAHRNQEGKPLASAPTLNRLEIGNARAASRYHRIVADHEAIERLLLRRGVMTLRKDTREVVVDFDATGSLVHGMQEGRFFQGYYGDYCYLPLYAFVGDVPLWAQLRTAERDAADGAVEALAQIVAAIRKRCPKARIIVRGDSGFCREPLMNWCEGQRPVVYYCLGLQRNERLVAALGEALFRARADACLRAGTARVFTEFEYQTRRGWSRARRVIGKAEVVHGEDNPRFVVSNLPREGWRDDPRPERFTPQPLYEQLYCARGEMENRIKEQQLDLFGARTSSHWLASNQLRLWLSTFALLLMERLRTLALRGTELAQATAGTIRVRLLKVGALIEVSVRRVHVRLSSAFPLQSVFTRVQATLRSLPAVDG